MIVVTLLFCNIITFCSASQEWTSAQEKLLWDLRKDSTKSWNQIGHTLGRSAKSCQNKYKRFLAQYNAPNQIILRKNAAVWVKRPVKYFPLLKSHLKQDVLHIGYLNL